jgi:hypothetical protein
MGFVSTPEGMLYVFGGLNGGGKKGAMEEEHDSKQLSISRGWC